ncbi:major facilitator superfamily domain-containing protein [Mycena floridula]|nr:major facilitator superfamily domain-containing protein [Mycena floridula]
MSTKEEKPDTRRFKKHSLKVGNRVTNAAELTLKETIFPLFLVTILGLQAAYFGAYPLASLGYGNWVLRNYGYRATFILGLVLYGIGALMMWPAALHRSFGGFCGATFIIVTGPPRYAELRINLAQAVQAIGTVVGPVLGSYAFFKDTGDSVNSLKSVQWVYLAIAVFVFYADMAQQAELTHVGEQQGEKPFSKQYKLFHAAFAQFCYTGAQVAIAGYFINYITETRGDTSASLGAKFLAIAQGCFAIGRFSGSAIMRVVKPRYVLLVYLSGVIAFCSASITQRGNTGLAMLMITLFFESVVFPTIVAIGIRGLGRHTKRGSGWIVAGVAGGACVPPLLAAVADLHNSTAFAMVVPVCFFVAAYTYALAVNFVPAYRDVVDKTGTVGLVPASFEDVNDDREGSLEKPSVTHEA